MSLTTNVTEFRPTFLELVRRVAPDFDGVGRWKMVRHLDNRAGAPDLLELLRADPAAFDFYQADQTTDVFGKCDGIFAFAGRPNRRALFLGGWRVRGTRSPAPVAIDEVPLALRPLYQHLLNQNDALCNYRYDLAHDPVFQPLERAVEIDWGRGAITWHQWDLEKRVVGLRSQGQFEPCPDYSDIDVRLGKLSEIMANETANPTWHDKLTAVGGVYLLSDRRHNRLYVGKAHGKGGFWARWKAYAQKRSGNVAVDAAFGDGTLALEDTWLSVLQVVPLGPNQARRVDELEARWKVRLRSREVGLNRN